MSTATGQALVATVGTLAAEVTAAAASVALVNTNQRRHTADHPPAMRESVEVEDTPAPAVRDSSRRRL